MKMYKNEIPKLKLCWNIISEISDVQLSKKTNTSVR